jgi:hypothetical protein
MNLQIINLKTFKKINTRDCIPRAMRTYLCHFTYFAFWVGEWTVQNWFWK